MDIYIITSRKKIFEKILKKTVKLKYVFMQRLQNYNYQ